MLEDVFLTLRAQVLAAFPSLEVGLLIDEAAGKRSYRACAYCADIGGQRYMIGVAPRMLGATQERVEGVLAHEFGHVLLLASNLEDHTERDADLAAEEWFGIKVNYDSDDIQTSGPGVHPRPAYLDDENGRTC